MQTLIASATPASHLFEVNVELFDGPLDLLLHLVKVRELPIERVSLAEVSAQYLACIQAVRQLDVEAAGEYLVIAATLLAIKSSVLLNDPIELPLETEEEESTAEAELLRRLKEMELYRRTALNLSSKSLLGVDVFPSSGAVPTNISLDGGLAGHSPLLLGKAFHKLLKRKGSDAISFIISVDSVSISDRMVRIINVLQEKRQRLRFDDLIEDFTTGSLIATFLALLELCKRRVIEVTQDELFDEIYLTLSGAALEDSADSPVQ